MTQAGPRRIGLFGGAFDPPHLGHVALARAAIEQLQLDLLLVMPTGHAWHKARALTQASHRLAMCALAFGGLGPVQVDARETQRSGPTYTVDTLSELSAQYPDAALHLLMGEDQARAFSTWHRANDVIRFAIICIAVRPQDPQVSAAAADPTDPLLLADAVRIQIPPHPESATAVRARVARGDGVGPMVSPAVARYIEDNHLYTTN